MEKYTSCWVKNCLEGQVQKVMVNGVKSNWLLIMIDAPQGQYWGQPCSNIFIDHLDKVIECTLSKAAPQGIGGTSEKNRFQQEHSEHKR